MLKKKRSIVLHCGPIYRVRPSIVSYIHCPSSSSSSWPLKGPVHPLAFLIRSYDEVKETCRAESMKGNVGHIGSCVVSLHTAYCGAARGGPLMSEG